MYEHRGGEADQKYINDSGENDVRVGQALRESVETAHRILSIVNKMARSVHADFHEVFPVDPKPIERYEQWKPKPRTKTDKKA